MEKNKTGKYLKYAIGEIILVVVGILIALSINNWNENRKLKKQEIYLLVQMQKEFKTDSLMLDRFTFLSGKKVREGKLLRKVINNEIKMSNDSIVAFSFFNGKAVTFDSYSPTFDEIVSSGKLGVLSSDVLKNTIKNYRNMLGTYGDFLYTETRRRKETYNTHLFRYFEAEIMTHLWENVDFGSASVNGLDNFKMDIDGFLGDPETLNQINTVIGVDRELEHIYSNNYKRLLNDLLIELQMEIERFNE